MRTILSCTYRGYQEFVLITKYRMIVSASSWISPGYPWGRWGPEEMKMNYWLKPLMLSLQKLLGWISRGCCDHNMFWLRIFGSLDTLVNYVDLWCKTWLLYTWLQKCARSVFVLRSLTGIVCAWRKALLWPTWANVWLVGGWSFKRRRFTKRRRRRTIGRKNERRKRWWPTATCVSTVATLSPCTNTSFGLKKEDRSTGWIVSSVALLKTVYPACQMTQGRPVQWSFDEKMLSSAKNNFEVIKKDETIPKVPPNWIQNKFDFPVRSLYWREIL